MNKFFFNFSIRVLFIFFKFLTLSLQVQSTSLFNQSCLQQESLNPNTYGSSFTFSAYDTNNGHFPLQGRNNLSLPKKFGHSFPVNDFNAMDNWNSGELTPGPSNWGNSLTITHQNFGGMGSYPRHNSEFSHQARMNGSNKPSLCPLPQCSQSWQSYPQVGTCFFPGSDTLRLELPDLYPPSIPKQTAGQSRDVLPRDVYNQLTPDQKLSRKKKLSVKRSTIYNERKKNERESLEIRVGLEENTNLLLTQEYKQILKQRDIMEKATNSLRNRNGNIF